MKTDLTFRPSPSVKKRETDPQNAFAARHFAARRAGFLLRELARQQQQAEREPDIEEIQEAIIEPAEDFEATLAAERAAEEARQQQALQAAHQRGREEALAEVAQGLDQAILALDAAARALAERQARLERDVVVPLAKAGVDIGAQLARQKLATPEGLTLYLESVQEALRDQGDEAVTITAHLHPDDLALLDRGQVKPQHLRLLSDPLVSAGGVMLSATDQVIDDRFESRLREVREAALSASADVLRLAPALEAQPEAAQVVTVPEVTAPDVTISPPMEEVSQPQAEAQIPELAADEEAIELQGDDLRDLQMDTDAPDFMDDEGPADLDNGPSDFIE